LDLFVIFFKIGFGFSVGDNGGGVCCISGVSLVSAIWACRKILIFNNRAWFVLKFERMHFPRFLMRQEKLAMAMLAAEMAMTALIKVMEQAAEVADFLL